MEDRVLSAVRTSKSQVTVIHCSWCQYWFLCSQGDIQKRNRGNTFFPNWVQIGWNGVKFINDWFSVIEFAPSSTAEHTLRFGLSSQREHERPHCRREKGSHVWTSSRCNSTQPGGQTSCVPSRRLPRNLQHFSQLYWLNFVQWCDSSSWDAFVDIAQIKNIIFVLTLRPMEKDNEALQELKSKARYLKLQKLNTEDSHKVIAEMLGVTNVPPQLMETVTTRSEGNPFLMEQLISNLKDQGVFKIFLGKCVLAPGVDFHKLNLPDNIQGIIVSRLDK